MIYEDYLRRLAKLREAQSDLDHITDELTELFQQTQPGAIRTDLEKVKASHDGDAFDRYLEVKAAKRLDERILEARTIVSLRREQLQAVEEDLRRSMDVADRIYVMRFLLGWRFNRIASNLHYQERQIFRIYRDIRDTRNDILK